MDGSEVLGGALAMAFGGAFVLSLWRYSRNEDIRLRAAKNRELDRWLSPAIRRGKMTVQEWNQRFADHQRWLSRKVGIPGGLLFAAAGLALLVLGLASK